jgi:hypothetical protein
LRDAISYHFPTNQTLNVGERILVIPFDPVADPAAAAAFRNQYGISAGVRLFGPYQGRLANGNDSVELLQPDQVRFYVTNLVTTAVLIDRVEYEDQPPWPLGADGLSFSLQRVVESAYGNDPTNWIAAAPTPGAALAPGVAPTIRDGPLSQTVAPGSDLTFRVEATGPDPLLYQWRFEGENLPGAQGPSLTLTNVQPGQSGAYQVVVSTAARSTASAVAALQVVEAPTILTQPASIETWPVDAVMFSVIAVGNSSLRYQWRRNGSPVPGATGSALRLTNVTALQAGVYDVVVSDATRATPSEAASLRVLGTPVIVQQPLGITMPRGSDAAFSVEVTNTALLPISYEWRKDGVTVSRRTVAARMDFLTLTPVQPDDAGAYSVEVSNRASGVPGFMSDTVTLQVEELIDSDGDGLPDAFESAHGLDLRNPADAQADADQDGASNLEEYRAGTDPQDPASVLRVTEIEATGAIVIRFSCLASRTYTLLCRDMVGSGPWRPLASIPATASTGTETRLVEVVDPQAPPTGERYYRIVTPAASGP